MRAPGGSKRKAMSPSGHKQTYAVQKGMSALPPMWGNRLGRSLWIAEDFGCCASGLMVETRSVVYGLKRRQDEAQHGAFCRTRTSQSRINEHLHSWMPRAGSFAKSKVAERTRTLLAGAEARTMPITSQRIPDWKPGHCRSGFTALSLAFGLAGDLRRDAAHASGVAGADQQSSRPTVTMPAVIAQMMRAGLSSPVHVKTLRSHEAAQCC